MKTLPWPAMALALFFGVWGLHWGLPSAKRAALFLPPDLRNEAFYQKLQDHRDHTYEKMGHNPIAYYGRQARAGRTYEDTFDPLAVYSGFLVRTHHGDEQQTLVMLSRLNPFAGKWYPFTFQYGGAYIYPLGAFLKSLQAIGVLKLRSDISFYYAHPDEIGKVYLAVRAWSVLALILACVPLFCFTRQLLDSFRAAHLVTCLFVLLPACIGNAKLAKPHMWAAVWTLSMIYWVYRARKENAGHPLWFAAGCFGLAVGTTVSQAVFLPFLIWGCWRPRFQDTLGRLTLAAGVSLAVFLSTNFYIVTHWIDFLDELYLFRTFYPFGITARSIMDFFFSASPIAAGYFTWGLMASGLIYAAVRMRNSPLGTLAVLTLITSVLLAFQNQSQLGSPVISRLFLGLLGLECLFAGWILFGVFRSPPLAGISLAVALGLAGLYAAHYASDRVPHDNASLAAQWVHENVPHGSSIAQGQALPQTFGFPPIRFADYRIVQIGTPTFNDLKGKSYAILPDWAQKERNILLEKGYVRVQRFAQSPLQRLGFKDGFTTANFPLSVYMLE